MSIREIARVAHEANRAYCRSLGDFSQVSWNTAPQWQCESTLHGVEEAIANFSLTAEENHESWLRCKLSDGWEYGPEKNVEKKTQPCCVPFNQLPFNQQIKDELFLAIVRVLGPTVEKES